MAHTNTDTETDNVDPANEVAQRLRLPAACFPNPERVSDWLRNLTITGKAKRTNSDLMLVLEYIWRYWEDVPDVYRNDEEFKTFIATQLNLAMEDLPDLSIPLDMEITILTVWFRVRGRHTELHANSIRGRVHAILKNSDRVADYSALVSEYSVLTAKSAKQALMMLPVQCLTATELLELLTLTKTCFARKVHVPVLEEQGVTADKVEEWLNLAAETPSLWNDTGWVSVTAGTIEYWNHAEAPRFKHLAAMLRLWFTLRYNLVWPKNVW